MIRGSNGSSFSTRRSGIRPASPDFSLRFSVIDRTVYLLQEKGRTTPCLRGATPRSGRGWEYGGMAARFVAQSVARSRAQRLPEPQIPRQAKTAGSYHIGPHGFPLPRRALCAQHGRQASLWCRATCAPSQPAAPTSQTLLRVHCHPMIHNWNGYLRLCTQRALSRLGMPSSAGPF